MTRSQWSFAVSAFLLGGIVGAVAGGLAGRHMGRRTALLWANVVFALGGIVIFFSPDFVTFVVGRVLLGMASAVATVFVVKYIGEVCPSNHRAKMNVINQHGIVLGLLTAALTTRFLLSIGSWRYIMLVMPLALAAVQTVLMLLYVPESPRWRLLQASRRGEEQLIMEQCKDDLRLLWGQAHVEDIMDDIMIQVEEDRERTSSWRNDLAQLVSTRERRRALLVAIMVQVAQQCSGVNAIFYFSSELMAPLSAGISLQTANVIIASANLLFTFLPYMLFRAGVGQRRLLLVSTFGVLVGQLCIMLTEAVMKKDSILTVVSLTIFVSSFSVGLGPIPWMVPVDVFPMRSIGPALVVPVNWLFNFLVSITFIPLREKLGDTIFAPYLGLTLVSFILIYLLYQDPQNLSVGQTKGTQQYGTYKLAIESEPPAAASPAGSHNYSAMSDSYQQLDDSDVGPRWRRGGQ